jgi:hypothetical protein
MLKGVKQFCIDLFVSIISRSGVNLESSLNSQIQNDLKKLNKNILKYNSNIIDSINIPYLFAERFHSMKGTYKENSYDIEKNNSVTSLCEASVTYELELYCKDMANNVKKFCSKEIKAKYIYKNNAWLINEALITEKENKYAIPSRLNVTNLFE